MNERRVPAVATALCRRVWSRADTATERRGYSPQAYSTGKAAFPIDRKNSTARYRLSQLKKRTERIVITTTQATSTVALVVAE